MRLVIITDGGRVEIPNHEDLNIKQGAEPNTCFIDGVSFPCAADDLKGAIKSGLKRELKEEFLLFTVGSSNKHERTQVVPQPPQLDVPIDLGKHEPVPQTKTFYPRLAS